MLNAHRISYSQALRHFKIRLHFTNTYIVLSSYITYSRTEWTHSWTPSDQDASASVTALSCSLPPASRRPAPRRTMPRPPTFPPPWRPIMRRRRQLSLRRSQPRFQHNYSRRRYYIADTRRPSVLPPADLLYIDANSSLTVQCIQTELVRNAYLKKWLSGKTHFFEFFLWKICFTYN